MWPTTLSLLSKQLLHFIILGIATLNFGIQAAVLLNPSMRTIGGALKGVPYAANTEMELFSFNEGEPGVITEQWFAVFGPASSPGADPLIRVYYDGPNNTSGTGINKVHASPSLEFRLFMGHGISPFGCTNLSDQRGCTDPMVHQVVPNDPNQYENAGLSSWGSELLGHGSTGGAHKNTYRIPFGAEHGIRITLMLPFNGVVYYYCRGMTNYPVIIGDVQLPSSARLKLHINSEVTVQPREMLPVVPRTAGNSGGLLFQVTLAANSTFIGFMEGCVRAYIDDVDDPTADPIHLSSGTEDYFEGANFFDTGLMRSPQSGVTWVTGRNPGPYSMTAFKHHVRDPVVWWDSFQLTFRNFDNDGVQCGLSNFRGQENTTNRTFRLPNTQGLEPVVMSSYAWTYEWPMD